MQSAREKQLRRKQVWVPEVGLQMPLDEMEPYQRELLEHRQENAFDLRVQISDPKTGILLKYQPYRLLIENGEEKYYRRDEKGIERCYSASGYLLDGPEKKEIKAK